MVKLKRWDVEDPQFWDETGKKVAYRNLVVSIPNLLCGFSVRPCDLSTLRRRFSELSVSDSATAWACSRDAPVKTAIRGSVNHSRVQPLPLRSFS